MKTQATFFALLAAMTLVSTNVFAAGARDIRIKTEAETKEVTKSVDIFALKGAKTVEEYYDRGAQALGKISNGRADTTELKTAMKRTVYLVSEGKHQSLYNIAKNLLKLDEVSQEIRIKGGLTPDGLTHLKDLDNAVDIGTQFLAMASRTSSQTKLKTELTDLDQGAEAAFNKQLSILMELGSMNTKDLISHTTVMKAAVARKTSPKVNGEEALMLAIKKDFAKGDAEKARKVTKDLVICKFR